MPDYQDRVEVPIAHRVSAISRYWKYVDKKTEPIACICCGDNAMAVYYCPMGTKEAINIIQPLCTDHHKNFEKLGNEMYVLEEFRDSV